METALGLLQPGELLVVQPDEIEETLEIVKRFAAGRDGAELAVAAGLESKN